jgi:hypothetical protein
VENRAFRHDYECRRVLRWLQDHPEGGTAETIAEDLGSKDPHMNITAVNAALGELAEWADRDHYAVLMDKDVWQVTPEGMEVKV